MMVNICYDGSRAFSISGSLGRGGSFGQAGRDPALTA